VFLISGRLVPRTGGMILARCVNRDELERILAEDPFHTASAATYDIKAFSPTKWQACFDDVLSKP